MVNKKLVLVIMIVSLILFLSNLGFTQEQPCIAVVGITSSALGYIWSNNSPLSQAATELMINALLGTNRFRVFERSKLDLLLQEQDFQNISGLVDQATAVKLGKMIGVDAILTGSLTI
jgi:curli biogenesis system outer membrane secretion channel CsgG